MKNKNTVSKEDVIIMGYSLKKCLDQRGWEEYINGSDKLKEAIELGVKIQILQLERAFRRLDKLTITD